MRILQTLISPFVAGVLVVQAGAGPGIGLVLAKGTFRIDNSQVYGNSTLFDGSTIETARAGSELQLNNGVRTVLGPGTLCRVHRDRLILDKGRGRIENAGQYRVEVLGLSVLPVSAADVWLAGPDRVRVSAVNGPVRIAKAGGVLIARLEPGKTLELQAQAAGASTMSKVRGVLEKRNGRFVLKDETSGLIVELLGEDLDSKVGSQVEVTGATAPDAKPAAGAAHALRVITIQVITADRRAAAAAAGMTAAKKAVIAGVVVAAVATGAAVAATRGEEKPPVSP